MALRRPAVVWVELLEMSRRDFIWGRHSISTSEKGDWAVKAESDTEGGRQFLSSWFEAGQQAAVMPMNSSSNPTLIP
jgi:hypothetical protein